MAEHISTVVLWLPLAAVALHLFEEFVWPGGSAEWYRHYPPGADVPVSPGVLVILNAIFVGLALMPPMLRGTPRGLAIWLVVAATAGANGVFHLVTTVRARAYAPGVVTGVTVYVPLALVGGLWMIHHHLVGPAAIAEAIVVALLYHVWSAWSHSRHDVRRPVP